MTPRLRTLRRVITIASVCLVASAGAAFGLDSAGEYKGAKVAVGVGVGLLVGDARAILAYRKALGD